MRLGRTAPLILVAAALSACGGGGGGDEASETSATSPQPGQTTIEDQTAIRRTLERLATEADPALCTAALTERWVEDSFPPAAEESLTECRDSQRPGTKMLAEGIRLGPVEVEGNEAVATFAELGPGVGGSRARVRLLQDGEGVWRVDETLAVQITDRARYMEAARADLLHGRGAPSQRQADCMVGELNEMPSDVIERLSVANESPVRIFVACLGGSPRAAVLAITRRFLADSPRYGQHSACVLDRLGRTLDDDVAREYLEQEDRDTLTALVARALARCGAVPPLSGEDPSVA